LCGALAWKLGPIELTEAMKDALYWAMLVERLFNTHKRHKSGRLPANTMGHEATS
jgi:hypothetical protein